MRKAFHGAHAALFGPEKKGEPLLEKTSPGPDQKNIDNLKLRVEALLKNSEGASDRKLADLNLCKDALDSRDKVQPLMERYSAVKEQIGKRNCMERFSMTRLDEVQMMTSVLSIFPESKKGYDATDASTNSSTVPAAPTPSQI